MKKPIIEGRSTYCRATWYETRINEQHECKLKRHRHSRDHSCVCGATWEAARTGKKDSEVVTNGHA